MFLLHIQLFLLN